MGDLFRFRVTGCRSAALAVPLASNGLARCEAVLHGYGTSPFAGSGGGEGGLYRLLTTVRTHGDFIVLPHLNTQSHYPDTERTSPCLILIMPSAGLGSNKYQFYSHWFDSTRIRKLWGLDSNPQPSDSPISQNRRPMLFSCGHPDWCTFSFSSHTSYHRLGITEILLLWHKAKKPGLSPNRAALLHTSLDH